MTQQTINVGTAANDRTGDTLRLAFQKVNANFTELYSGGASESQLTNGAYTVTLGTNGALTFPDATVQTTAYQQVAVPAHSYGAAGDKVGMIAFDSTYIYYCTANYVNTSTNIWKRTAHGAGTW